MNNRREFIMGAGVLLGAGRAFGGRRTGGAEGNGGYHLRSGLHDITVSDWRRYLDFADGHGWNLPVAPLK